MKKDEDSILLYTYIFPVMKTALDKNAKAFISTCQKLVADNSTTLFSSNPGLRVYFTSALESEMFRLCDVTTERLGAIIASTGLNNADWFQRNRPIYALLWLAQHYFYLKKQEKERKAVLMAMIIIIYAGRQSKFYRFNTGVGFANVMAYTANNLSNKFLLKREDTIYGMLDHICSGLMKTYARLLSSQHDKDAFTYIMNNVTRTNNVVKKIAQQFYLNQKSGKYINTQSSQDAEDGHLMERENASSLIGSLTDNCYTVIKSSPAERRITNRVAQIVGVTPLSLYTAAESTHKQETESIKTLLRCLLSVFFIQEKRSKEDICSPSYLNTVLKVYAQSHTTNNVVIELKKSLDDIMSRNSADYVKTQRAATQGNYKKGIFIYFALVLQRTVCSGT